MKSIILCEGPTDGILLQYFMLNGDVNMEKFLQCVLYYLYAGKMEKAL